MMNFKAFQGSQDKATEFSCTNAQLLQMEALPADCIQAPSLNTEGIVQH